MQPNNTPPHLLQCDVWAGSRLRLQLPLALCTGGAGLRTDGHLQVGSAGAGGRGRHSCW